MNTPVPTCMLCHRDIEIQSEAVQITKKDSHGINETSKQRGDTHIQTNPGDYVHKNCRKLYTNPNLIKKTLRENSNSSSEASREQIPLVLRSQSVFNFCYHCLFCGHSAKLHSKKRGNDVFPVRTSDFQTKVIGICDERDDDWAAEVRGRMQSVNDLHAADAVYHQSCNMNFRTRKSIPQAFSPEPQKGRKQTKKGRPNITNEYFQEIVDYLTVNEDEQITIADLVEKMTESCGRLAYTTVYMKKKLLEHFGENVFITEINGKPNVVTLRHTAKSILQDFYQNPKETTEDEKSAIIETAAKFIKNDIKSVTESKDFYPSSSDISAMDLNLNYVPDSLKTLLQSMFSEKDSALKVAAIGQAIMQATRPRALLSPLQIGLGVQLHHHFGSRFLIDTCHNLGFCAPYTEVQRFASCAAASQGTSIQGVFPESCLQFVADNVDHNIRTLDGNNTFHGMGIIAGVTPGVRTTKHIPRTPVTMDDLKQLGKIKIHHYRQHTNRMSELSFVELKDIQKMDSTLKLDNFTKIVWPLKSPMPGWAGFMQLLQTGTHPGKSSVTFLPMIDLSPSDMTCIYSTLKFVQEQAKTYDRTPIITFDQPLYWKAFTIISNEDQGSDMRSIVLRLGGFHLEMSFLGAISHIMRGSGLQQILETVYAPNAVLHMRTGKAVARALRGHMLVDIALHALLVSIVFRVPLHKEDDNGPVSETREETSDHTDESRDNLTKLSDMCDLLIAGDISVDALCNSSILVDVLNVFAAETQAMGKLRTASLWLQYSEMIQLLRSFIKAERTGDWELHLKCIQEMLPYLAAAGHNLYTKSAYTYLSEMQKLEYDNPDVYQQFLSGYHVFRRSDRYWAGLSCDLVIEQELMRSVKTSGGLTRGRGIGETQRAQWLLSMPACADINNALQVLTGVGFQTSDQETSEARKERDFKDITTIISFMNERNPFSDNESLRNIETGAIADKTVNQDIAKAVGERIIKSMVGKKILDYSFKRSQQVVTLGEKSCLKVDGDPIQIDPQLLFQRLTIAASGRFDDTSEIFKYELCSYPSSIFDSSGLPRVAQKAALAECIWNLGECGIESLPPDPDIIYVLDGGSLLQRISWNIGQSFSTICQSYVEFVKRNYTDAVVVFDGYRNELSTKDVAHMRRTHGVISQRIDFTEEMPCRCKKEAFLCNSKNKQRFIDMLSCKLQGNGCTTVHADEDADLLIVQTAVKCADIKDVVVIGEDTDLLVLLCYHSGFQFHNIYFKSDCKRSLGKQMKIWDINKTKAALGDVCRLLPALHALTGCDTTSRLFGIGKGPALNKLRSSDVLKDHAAVFLDPTSDVNSITKAGEELLTTWF